MKIRPAPQQGDDIGNGLSMAQIERLALLLEELGEAQQIIGKILRHGFSNCHPDNPGITNKMLLEKELGHASHAICLLLSGGDISGSAIREHRIEKSESIAKWLHHQ